MSSAIALTVQTLMPKDFRRWLSREVDSLSHDEWGEVIVEASQLEDHFSEAWAKRFTSEGRRRPRERRPYPRHMAFQTVGASHMGGQWHLRRDDGSSLCGCEPERFGVRTDLGRKWADIPEAEQCQHCRKLAP